MAWLRRLLLLLLFPAAAFGQGYRYDNFVLKPLNTGGVTPVSGALITVCTSAGTGTPCTPKVAQIYSDQALTVAITGTGGAGTTNSDANGNYGFYISAGTYVITITGSGITSTTVNVTFPFGSTAAGAAICKNFESIRCEDGFAGATPAARVSASLLDCGASPCTVLVPGIEPNTELLGNLTTAAAANQLVWTMNNGGYGATQGTNWLICDFAGTAGSSPCRNPAGPQAFQIGRTFNNSPANGNQIATLWGKWTGVSANTIGFPPDTLGIVTEASGLTQSNGTPAPLIGLDLAASVSGNNTAITNWRFISTDPGGLQNAGSGNTITNMYGYYAQGNVAMPAGLTVTNWYNGWFEDPFATRVTNSYALWSNGRTVVNDASNLTQPLLSINYNNTRANNGFQVYDATAGRVAIEVAQNGRFDVFQHANGVDGILLSRFTDAGPTGLLIHSQNAALNADVFDVSVAGGVQATLYAPIAAGAADLGTTALPLGNMFIGTAATNNFKFQPAATAAARIITIADPLSPSTVALPLTIGTGTAAMTTAGIATGACGTTVTVAATGVLTTDTIDVSRNAAATIGNGGGLTLNWWPTAGNVNFNYCNSAAGTITPTAMTVNWAVRR